MEQALAGKNVGESCRVRLEPDDAFGDYDAELVHIEPRDKFPENVAVGMQFEGARRPSPGETLVYTVTDIADDKVVVDGNHPLAGRDAAFRLHGHGGARRDAGRDHARPRARAARPSSLSAVTVIGD